MTNEAAVSRVATLVIVLCLAGLAGTASVVVSPSLRQALGLGPVSDAPAYQIGDRVDVDPAIYGAADTTVILFALSTCAACQQGRAFYATALAAALADGRAAAMVTPSPDRTTEEAFAAAVGLAGHQVHHAVPGAIKLRAVPALMVVNRSGTIERAWFGLPDQETQTAILTAVSRSQDVREP